MEKQEKDAVYYERKRTMLMAAMLAVLVAVSAVVCVGIVSLRRYESQIGAIINRLDAVTAELEKLDTEKLVKTANDFTDAMEQADLKGLVDSLNKVTDELAEIDMRKMTGDVAELIEQAQQSLTEAEKTLEDVGTTIDSMDLEALNKAIADLSSVVEPLAKFASRFG